MCVHMYYVLKIEDKLSRPNMEPPHETTFQLSGWASSRETEYLYEYKRECRGMFVCTAEDVFRETRTQEISET